MAAKRRVIGSEARRIVANVYHFLREEYEFTKNTMEHDCDLSHLRNITRRTAEATGVSEKTVGRILKEEKELPSSLSEFPSRKKRKIDRKVKVKIGKFTAEVVKVSANDKEINREYYVELQTNSKDIKKEHIDQSNDERIEKEYHVEGQVEGKQIKEEYVIEFQPE